MAKTQTTPNYDIDYTDERFEKVETEKTQALTELEQTYGGMIDSTDKFYDDLKNANQQWADKQAQIQQEQTDFAIEKIEQQKEQTEKDYLKEQSGAYVDWQKQSNAYGTNAEKMASSGLTNTGYAESSQVSMYNTYQMRVATARETLAQAKLNYDNNIKEAMLANNAALAQIYADAYIKQAELALEGFQYKNQLVLEMANKKIEVDNIYYNRWRDVLQQINTENAMAEEVRQYNETMAWNTEQNELDREHDSAEAQLDREAQAEIAQAEREFEASEAQLDREHELALQTAKTADEIEILNEEWRIEKLRIAEEKNAKIAQIKAQGKEDRATISHENSLKSTSSGSSGSGSSGTKIKGSTNTTLNSVVTNAYNALTNELKTINKISSYGEAASYLKSKGITATLKDFTRWSGERTSYKMTGNGSDDVKYYDSYEEYLRARVKYFITLKYGS